MSIKHHTPVTRIIHSDHGSQFISYALSRRIKVAGVILFMGSIHDGYDNAPMKSFWWRMQTHLFNTKGWDIRAELTEAIFSYIGRFYNWQQRHSALGYGALVEYEDLQLQATSMA